MSASTGTAMPRIGARVLLLDPANRVLLIHALNPADPDHHWWELPGGGLDHGEDLQAAARREVAEETGITLLALGRKLCVRESDSATGAVTTIASSTCSSDIRSAPRRRSHSAPPTTRRLG
jgi:8-oxo-dGTP pyrophosphatase MutT (NUDIX family)